MERLNAIFLSAWFGDALLFTLCLGVVVTASVLTPSPEHVSFLGTEIPVVCSFRNATGWSCPGCGLTRSFTFMGHIAPVKALEMNPLGPPLYLVVLFQIPYRLYRLVKNLLPESRM